MQLVFARLLFSPWKNLKMLVRFYFAQGRGFSFTLPLPWAGSENKNMRQFGVAHKV